METRQPCLRLFATLILAPSLSLANDHQICYQYPPPPGSTTISAQFLCRTDGTTPPGCQVTGVTGAATFFHTTQGAGDEVEATFAAAGTYVGTIHFNDGITRTCTLEIPANPALQPAKGQQIPGVLAFTTDASGLVTTGIWSAKSFATTELDQITRTPPDFVAVGGGFTGAMTPAPILMDFSNQDLTTDLRQWYVNGQGTSVGAVASVTGFAIGMKIEGLTFAQLNQLIAVTQGNPSYPPSSRPSVTQTLSVSYPQSSTAISGGARIGTPGQFMTTSMPLTAQQCFSNSTCEEQVSGWKAASLSTAPRFNKHSPPPPSGQISPQLITLPKLLTIAGQQFHVETWVLSASSTSTLAPSASVTLPIDYALTGIGAAAFSSGFLPSGANFLWSVVPIQGGASASAEVLPLRRAGVVTAHAIGIKLVAGPIPALAPPNFNKLPGAGKVIIKPPAKTT